MKLMEEPLLYKIKGHKSKVTIKTVIIQQQLIDSHWTPDLNSSSACESFLHLMIREKIVVSALIS